MKKIVATLFIVGVIIVVIGVLLIKNLPQDGFTSIFANIN